MGTGMETGTAGICLMLGFASSPLCSQTQSCGSLLFTPDWGRVIEGAHCSPPPVPALGGGARHASHLGFPATDTMQFQRRVSGCPAGGSDTLRILSQESPPDPGTPQEILFVSTGLGEEACGPSRVACLELQSKIFSSLLALLFSGCSLGPLPARYWGKAGGSCTSAI